MKARLPQGYGSGQGNMNSMLKQAQKMQEMMAEKQAEIAAREFRATAGGNMVEAVLSGKKELLSVSLKPEIVDPDDIEMLQDLIVAAVNEGLRQVEEVTAAEMNEITGGMQLPGML